MAGVWFRRLSLAICLIAPVARADGPAPVIRYVVRLPISEFRAGGARTTVAAPHSTVHTLVTDYPHYSEFVKAFETSKVVGRDGTKTDVYLRVKILKGAAKIWAVVRFDPPVIEGDFETVNAHMVKGNVKRLDAIWHLHRVDDAHTQLALELLIVPDLPVPEALVVPEVRDAAATAVTGVRDESEKRITAK